MGTWESTGTLETSKFNGRGQNTLHWGTFISLESYRILYVENGLAWATWTFATQVMAKRKAGSQFDSRPLKVANRPTPVHAGGVQHTVRKLSTRATSLLQISSQLEVWAKSYSPAKLQESKLG
jgi:hypothetical protein